MVVENKIAEIVRENPGINRINLLKKLYFQTNGCEGMRLLYGDIISILTKNCYRETMHGCTFRLTWRDSVVHY